MADKAEQLGRLGRPRRQNGRGRAGRPSGVTILLEPLPDNQTIHLQSQTQRTPKIGWTNVTNGIKRKLMNKCKI
ncbi:hypothetical protein BpHYR1_020931 [Brachionus plicatilis]|uniref:Uncharacterized protein n=1 Tax=Brachionus plicatilis TaxID=10195 RepID=A0A3M7RR73_BRAPC|nr:hypothetical protein BpHYR1_020931 [Brachionus plicatilis]